MTAPAPFMPEAEVEHLTRAYADARVILEYGSGGSTEIAAHMPGKYIMSVESDRAWARALREKLSGSEVLSHAVIHHVDIGATGPWGRPLDDHAWRNFHAYPNDIWEQSWFRHPDVVLIDGRFRNACLATVLLRAERPVRVLFDDYGVRPLYHQIEEIIEPVRMIGRMAEFHVEPGRVRPHQIGVLLRQFFWVSVHGMSEQDYQQVVPRRLAVKATSTADQDRIDTTTDHYKHDTADSREVLRRADGVESGPTTIAPAAEPTVPSAGSPQHAQDGLSDPPSELRPINDLGEPK